MTTKICWCCKEEKPLEEFSLNPLGSKGRHSQCKVCKNKEQIERYAKRNLLKREQDSENQRAKNLKKKFGLTIAQYDELLAKQDYKCAVCRRPHTDFKHRLSVDHAHTGPRAGVIRGLLCSTCNQFVIAQHIDSEVFRKAAEYLEQDTGLFVPEEFVKPKRRRRKRKKRN